MSEKKETSLKSAGGVLSEARRSRKKSISSIAGQMRVSEDKLKALEEDNYDIFPGRFYARVCLREYAEFLGVELDPLKIIPPEGSQPISPEVELEEKLSRDKALKKKNLLNPARVILTVSALVLAGFIAAAGYYYITVRVASVPAVSDPEPSSEVIPEKVMVRAEATERTWVRVESDGVVVFESFLNPGSVREWEAEEDMNVRVGLVSALELYHRTSSVEPYRRVDIRSGAVRQVNQVQFSAGGPVSYADEPGQ